MSRLHRMLIIALLALGCTVRQTGFSVISTKYAELSRIDVKEFPVVREQEGRDRRLWFLFIPLAGDPKLEDAVDRCLEDGDGDFIINPVVSSTWWTIRLFSYGSWRIRGDVGKSLAGYLPEQKRVIIDE